MAYLWSLVLLVSIQALIRPTACQSLDTNITFSLPQAAGNNSTLRAAQVAINRAGYQYAPSPLVNGSYFLGGVLGDVLVASELAEFVAEAGPLKVVVQTDATLAQTAVTLEGGIHQISDYPKLYNGQWKLSNPTGVDPGLLTNYTEDLLFSMRRLSSNPFALERVQPNAAIDLSLMETAAQKLSGQSATSLQQAGRLFVSDHKDMAPLARNPGLYSGACTAYFFIHPSTGDFLPLSITTNTGANLTYTPLDPPQDWFLAKGMFEANDNFYIACFHFAATHLLAEIVHIASLRTMADQHPVRGFLDRIMFRAYAIRPAGATLVFNKGGSFDQSFAFGSDGFKSFSAQLYFSYGGRFQDGYLDKYFTDRGLINSTSGPAFSNFPYLEDVGPILDVIRTFTTTYVEAYYSDDAAIAADNELQAWFVEANGPANVFDFPPAPVSGRDTLIDVLTQMAFLTGVLHHSLNSGALARSWVLPLSPVSLFQPLPTKKGISSAVAYMPNVAQSVAQINIENLFNQPDLTVEGLTTSNMFADQEFKVLTKPVVATAAQQFMASMQSLGQKINAKTFDGSGLSQGMPFIWKDVNPLLVPFFLSV